MLIYRMAIRSGVLSIPGMRTVFNTSYRLYKAFVEARYVEVLRPWVRTGTTVVDVGANVGFFTYHFAQWTGRGGRVVAIEPESANFIGLEAMIRSRHLDGLVTAVRAAAAERNGEVALLVDPFHPGGHYLAPGGVATPAVTIDSLVRQHPEQIVSLIKIDVQGAELRVLQGARWTLESSRPALLVELDEGALRAQGGSVEQVIGFLSGYGYHGRLVSSGGLAPALDDRALIAASLARDYVDVLFLCDAASRS
jgi:FkbM family methyltransferase